MVRKKLLIAFLFLSSKTFVEQAEFPTFLWRDKIFIILLILLIYLPTTRDFFGQ